MKPNPQLRLGLPSSLSSSSTEKIFSHPYTHAPSQLSPIPASPFGEKSSYASSSSSNADDPHTPLLPATPGMAEGGSYPFPKERRGIRAKARLALGSLCRGGPRKVIWVVLLMLFTGVMWSSGREGFRIDTRPSASTSSPAPNDSQMYRTSTFRLPPIFPSRPYRPSPSGSIYSNAKAQGLREIDISSSPLPVEATLRERLDAWRDAPGGRGEVEGEIELGGFVQWNLEQCSTIHEQHNTHMIQKSVDVWASMNRTTLHQYRMELINQMEGVLAANLTQKYGEGRGIVMVAGNADTLTRVKWSLQMLRSYGSTLPVQVWHFPDERPADDDPLRLELRQLGAELVEAVGQYRSKNTRKSYHLKAIAVVSCPWREVLYLDSDSIPARDPEYMFDAPNYRRLGLWATPDYWKTSANNPIWAIMGVKCRNEWEMETGQMFIDKKLHLDLFLLIKYMLENHEFWFYFSDGDKDIFRWAMLALRKRWAVPGRWVGAAAFPSGTASGEFCAHTMLQHDSWGEPLFVHYNLLKQIPSGIGRGYSWGRTKQMPLFNLFPASPATARLGEPVQKPVDSDVPGLGDVDCDMLADADEYGVARSPAKEMIMRRAVKERGIKTKYHGGWISALCIDLDFIDPRAEDRRSADKILHDSDNERKALREEEWNALKQKAEKDGRPEPDRGEWDEKWSKVDGAVLPNWDNSPIEVVHWRDDPHLANFEGNIYDMGFKPSGPGF